MAKRKRKKGRALTKRYGRSHVGKRRRRGHSYAEGAASIPVRVHGTLYISPEDLGPVVEEVITESPQLVEAIVEEAIEETIPEVVAELDSGYGDV
jgi:hypothetical protein